MLLKLFLLFTLVPVIELALLIRIGTWIGPLWTIAIVLGTGAVGSWLAKREGFAVLRQLRDELREGLPPGSRLMEGALVVLGGVLLITPGVLSDVTGLLLIVPPARRWLAPRALAWLMRRFQVEIPRRGPAAPDLERPQVRKDPHFDHPVR